MQKHIPTALLVEALISRRVVTSKTTELHWDGVICFDTVAALQYSRAGQLMDLGVEPQTARCFALLESAHRQKLALTIGADAALMAKLVWEDHGEMGFGCRLEQDVPPENLNTTFFTGFHE